MCLVQNAKGNKLLEFILTEEEKARNFIPLTHARIVVKYEGNFLLVFNRYKQAWELPGGIIDTGETPRDCVIRELFEETRQSIDTPIFKGIMKFELQPNAFIPHQSIEFGALYSAKLTTVQEFIPNKEISQILFWDRVSPIAMVESLDIALLNYSE